MEHSSQLIRELEIQLKAKEGTLASLHKELLARKAVNEANTMELDKLREESSAHTETKMKLDAVTLLCKAKNSEFEKLKANREKMLGVISTLESELDQLRIERKSLSLQLDAVERTETEADESRELRHNMEIKVEEMQAELKEAQKQANGAQGRVYQLEDAVTHLKEALEKSHENSKAAWQRLKEIQGLSGEDKSSESHLRSKMAKLERKLGLKDAQLDESRKGIADAQKMIYRLMETVKELRKRARDHGLDDWNTEFRTAAAE
jgi:chromosome segregation ATPase